MLLNISKQIKQGGNFMKKILAVLSVLVLFTAYSLFAQNLEHSKWPTEFVHPDLPVYKDGKFKGWNQWDKSNTYSIFMIIEETNQSDADKYTAQLKAAGFEDKGDGTYRKDLFDVKLQFNSNTILQISSSKINVMEWPKTLLVGIPEQKKGALTEVLEPSEEMPDYVHLYFTNLTGQDVDAWLQDLKKAGFTIEGHSASKTNVSLGGKTYKSLSIQVEDNGPDEWMVDFNYSNE
jgi:hypothetical protein